MPDENKYDLFKKRESGPRLNLPKLQLTNPAYQRIELESSVPSLWIAPVTMEITNFSYKERWAATAPAAETSEKCLLTVTGKIIELQDRKNYLLGTSPVKDKDHPDDGVNILYTDKSKDPVTNNDQFSVGFQGLGFSGTGNIFIQGTSDQPGSGRYNSWQFVLGAGDIPLFAFHHITLTPQLQLDPTGGVPTVSMQVSAKNSIFKNIVFSGTTNARWGGKTVSLVFEY